MNAGMLARRTAQAQMALQEAFDRLADRFDLPEGVSAGSPPTRGDQAHRRLQELEHLVGVLDSLAYAPVKSGHERPTTAPEPAPVESPPPPDLHNPPYNLASFGFPDNPGPPVEHREGQTNFDVYGVSAANTPAEGLAHVMEMAERSNEQATRLDESRRKAADEAGDRDTVSLGFPDNPGPRVQRSSASGRNFSVYGQPVVALDDDARHHAEEMARRSNERAVELDESRRKAAQEAADGPTHHRGFPDNPGPEVMGDDPDSAAEEAGGMVAEERMRIANERQIELSEQKREAANRLREKAGMDPAPDPMHVDPVEAHVPENLQENPRESNPGGNPGTPVEEPEKGVAVDVTDLPPGAPDELGPLPLTPAQKDALREAGYDSLDRIAEADDDDLLAVKGVGRATVEHLRALVGNRRGDFRPQHPRSG